MRIVPNDALQHAFFKRPSGDMAPAVSAQAIADSASHGLNYAQQIAPQLMGALVDPAAASALSAQATNSLVNDLLALTQHSQVTGVNSSSNSAQAINSNQFVSANNSSGNYIDNNYFVSSQNQMHQVGNAGTNGGSNDASNSSESSFLLGFYWGC